MTSSHFSLQNPFLTLLTLLAWLFLILLAYALGRNVVRALGLNDEFTIENLMIAMSTGTGMTGFGILLLGIVGFFQPTAILSWILILALLHLREMGRILGFAYRQITTFHQRWAKSNTRKRIFIIGICSILLLAVILSLVPPWQYDGLMYHLEAPKRFLANGRIAPIPEIQQANGPLLTEMLFSLAIMLRLDSLANLIHLTFGILLAITTFAFGERYLGKNKGWIAAGILISTPLVPIIGIAAYVDLAWAQYASLALFILLLWDDKRETKWLILAGLLTGFSLGSKYMALGYAGILGLALIWLSLNQGWKYALSNVLYFSLPALFLGSPWYLKNLFATGNPVYPLFFGGPGWPPDRVALSVAFLNSFGTGRRLIDYLLLPYNIFRHSLRFSTVGSVEAPNPIFLTVFFYPLTKRSKSLNILAITSLLGFVLWAFGSQQSRFLLPIFPALSILSARVLIHLSELIPYRKLKNIFVPGIVGGLLLYCLLLSILLILLVQPISYIAGTESRDSFLSRIGRGTGNYRSMRVINENLNPDSKVLMVWDGRGYFCNNKCIPDTDNSTWTYLVLKNNGIYEFLSELNQMGITHILLNHDNANFALAHDPTGGQLTAYNFLMAEFIPSCTRLIYQDGSISIHKLDCQPQNPQE